MANTFYLFHGDDDIAIDEAVNALRAQMGDNGDLNTSEFDGQTASVAQIIGAVTSVPFLADKRLVIVRDLAAWITRKGAGATGKQAVEQLAEAVHTLPDYARLVLVERQALTDKNAVVLLASQAEGGYVRAYSVPKDTTGWIVQRARDTYGVEIDNRAAVALAAVTGTDLRRADNELVKLASFVEEGHSITEEDVAALTPYVPEANIFKMVDALVEGRGELALALLHRLMAEKDQDPLRLFGMIARQFRLLILAREHLDAGGTPGSVAGAIGERPFVAQNAARQARAFDMAQLERIYRDLLDKDLAIKTGAIKAELALDLFVASLARR